MADNLMIEVTGSAEKAETALDRIIKKIDELQAHFDKAAPSVSKFAAQMDKIASSSKAFSAFQKIAQGADKQAVSTKNAESRLAMYQARLDRATVSMERSRIQSEKLASAQKKLRDAAGIDAANEAFLKNFQYKGFPNPTAQTASAANVPTPPMGSSRLASDILKSQSASIHIDTTQAQSAVERLQGFIGGLNPAISHMSSGAQAEFNALSGRLMLVGQQIDNQRALYHKLAASTGEVAAKSGEGSAAYLRLEKRMLSASGSIDRLIARQDKLKAQMSDIAGVADKAGTAAAAAGIKSESAGKKSASGWGKTLQMMEKMLIRIAAFRIFSAVQQGITTGLQDMALANSQANATMSALATNSLYLKNSLAAALMPVLQSLIPVINQVTDALANVFNTIGMLVARIFNHATTVTIAKRANVNYAETLDKAGNSASNTTKKVKELQRTVMGFDELNLLSKQQEEAGEKTPKNPNPGMPAYKDMFETVKVPGWINKIGSFTDSIGKIIGNWWSGLTDAQKWGAGIGGTAGFIIGGIIGNLIGGPIGKVVGAALGAAAGVAIGVWWAGLTTPEKWAAGIGAAAGAIIGGIIGGLLGGKIGAVVGAALGGIIGAVTGKWWADLTAPEKWSAGIGAGAGAVIGGIIAGIITGGNPIGIVVGAALLGTVGAIIGQWWADLTTSQKWGVGIGSGAGAIIGGIVGGVLTGGNPIGIVVGVALGGTIGAIIGKWWAGLTTKQKWSVGIGAGAGTAIGGIIGGMIAGPIGAVIGGLLGGTIGTVIGNWWSGMTSKQKWSIGIGASAGTVIGGILGTLICPGIGTVLGAALGGTLGTVAGQAISKLTNPFKNIKWPKISTPHLEWTSGGWKATGWIYKVLDALQLPTQMPKLNVKWYAKGGLFDTPSLIGVGEAGPEAVMPLNDKVFTQIAQGIVENGQSNGSGSLDTERIIQRMDRMERAIRDMKLYLYTDDRKIAESSNRGNRLLGRTAPTA